jgi:hypothetical protein
MFFSSQLQKLAIFKIVLLPELWGPMRTLILLKTNEADLIGPKFFIDNLDILQPVFGK